MKKNILIDYLATTFHVMSFLKNLAENCEIDIQQAPKSGNFINVCIFILKAMRNYKSAAISFS